MSKKKDNENSKHMMKQQRSVISLPLSRLCRWLMLAVFTKLALLAFIFTDLVPNLIKEGVKEQLTASVSVVADLSTLPLSKNLVSDKILTADANRTVMPVARTVGGLFSVPDVLAQGNTATASPTAPKGQNVVAQATGDTLSREAMQQRQDELVRKEQELRTLEKSIDAKLEDLKTLESKLQVMLKEADSMKDQKYRHLVDVYSNMKAKQAAQVLETLDEKIAVKILAGMKGRQAGEILTFVIPAKAARLSESLTKMQMSF